LNIEQKDLKESLSVTKNTYDNEFNNTGKNDKKK